MVYTYPEVKELLSKAIPKDADEDIVMRALAAELNSRIQKDDLTSLSVCLTLIMPEGMSIRTIIHGFMDALTDVSLRYTKADRLLSSLKTIMLEIHVSYFANIGRLFEMPSWKSKHEPELNRILNGPDVELVPQEMKHILRKMLNI